MGNLVSILFKCGPDFLDELRLKYLPDGSRVASNIVSRQLRAVDCDEDGGIVMREIAIGLCAAGGCCPYYLGIPT
jgi:hypothetical protein